MAQATRVMDLTRGRSRIPVEVQGSLPVEMLVQLTAFASPESVGTYDDGTALFDRVRTRASAELLAALEPADDEADWKPWGNLIGLALLPAPASSLPEFVGRVEHAPTAPEWTGRRVVGEINAVCGDCEACRAGRRSHCERRTVLGIRSRHGAFAERLSTAGRVTALVSHDPRLPPVLWGRRRGLGVLLRAWKRFEKRAGPRAGRFLELALSR